MPQDTVQSSNVKSEISYPTYRVTNWDKHFENSRSRTCQRLEWVPVPNKHDGDGFTELMEHERGTAHFGCWVLIIELSSKCQPRGTLVRDNGKPHTPESIARVTRTHPDLVRETIDRLLQIGWLEQIAPEPGAAESPAQAEETGDCQAADRQVTGDCQSADRSVQNPVYARGTERNGREGKERQTDSRAREEPIPTWQEVKTEAEMRGYKEEDAEAFWNHFESTGWCDKNGHQITRWRPKLANWIANERKAANNGSQTRKESPQKEAAKQQRSKEPKQTINPGSLI